MIFNCPTGFLFRAQPALLTADTSSRIMDDIFSSSDEEARGRLLRIMQEFLVSESEKHASLQKEKGLAFSTRSSLTSTHHMMLVSKKLPAQKVDMEELVGNTDGFAESGSVHILCELLLPNGLTSLQCQLGYHPTILEPHLDSSAVANYANPSSCCRHTHLHHPARACTPSPGTNYVYS